jgi:hypothetical protein
VFIRAFITLVAADTVDRHMREQQHRAWLAEAEARTAAAEWMRRPEAPILSSPRPAE